MGHYFAQYNNAPDIHRQLFIAYELANKKM